MMVQANVTELEPKRLDAMYQELAGPYPAVVCECGHCIFTHQGVIRSRCVKVAEGVALCRCKRWVEVPVGMSFY
ncbi:hypothetical protein [Photobacterium salinisoli]|uniref:hypothetical protein n=1 Tax=Photobacterium salinisoli TaxID=1616783 RepID=UPI000EA1ED11|nr:hypothetical protein [Photobacterium salinisoli]